MQQNSQPSLAQQVAEVTVAYRLLFAATAFLICLMLAAGILRTSFDTSLTALLTKSDPYLEEYDALREQFPSPLEVSFAFIAKDGQHVFTHAILDAIAELRQNFENIPAATRLSSLLDYDSPDAQQKLFERPLEDYSQADLDSIHAEAQADRLLGINLLSPDSILTFATVSTNFDEEDNELRGAIAEAALVLRDQLRAAHPDVDIHVNSEVLLEQSSQQAMVDDLTSLMPIVILICVLTICYCFKSATIGVCILSHTILTIVATVGTLGYLSFAFNSVSVMAPLVVVIISIANSVHVISIFKQSLHKGSDALEAMRDSMQHNFQPISLAAVTTAIGFSSLNMCSSPAIREFGQIVAIGILFAYVLTLVFLPAVLVLFSKPIRRQAKTSAPFMEAGLKSLSSFTSRHDKAIFRSCSAFAVITIALLPLNETDFNRLDFIASDSDLKQYYDEVSERLNRGPLLNYGLDATAMASSGLEGVAEPAFLRRFDEFNDWLLAQEDVESVISMLDLVKTVHQIQNNNDEAFYRIPDDKNVIANYLLGYAIFQTDDFPLSDFVTADLNTLSLLINATPMSNQALIDLDQRITDRFQQDFPEVKLGHGSGILLFARMDELVTIELLQGYSLSLFLITLSLIVGLGSVYFGVLSVLPNLLPATMVFGVWALFVGQLDPFVMMLFSISIGLVIDDTVHMLSHYLNGRRSGIGQTESINQAILIAGPALSITTLVLALGTTILIGANTLYFQQAAKLLVPIVVLALALDLLYLPTILRRFDRKFPAVSTASS